MVPSSSLSPAGHTTKHDKHSEGPGFILSTDVGMLWALRDVEGPSTSVLEGCWPDLARPR